MSKPQDLSPWRWNHTRGMSRTGVIPDIRRDDSVALQWINVSGSNRSCNRPQANRLKSSCTLPKTDNNFIAFQGIRSGLSGGKRGQVIENDRLLIDFGKVPPGNPVITNGHPGMVFVFAGADQTKAVFEPA